MQGMHLFGESCKHAEGVPDSFFLKEKHQFEPSLMMNKENNANLLMFFLFKNEQGKNNEHPSTPFSV